MKFILLKKHIWIKLLILLGVVISIIAGVLIARHFLIKKVHYKAREASTHKYFNSTAVAIDAYQCGGIAEKLIAMKGNAVDIAIASIVCMGVVNPQSSGLGGGFFMTIYNRSEGRTYFLDSREIAPSSAAKDMYKSSPKSSQIGGKAIAIPGDIPGLYAAHQKFGFLEWKLLFKSVIDLCNEGFEVSKHLEQALIKEKDYVEKFENLKKTFTNPKTKKLYVNGERMSRPDLAKTLQIISSTSTYGELFNRSNGFFKQFYKELQESGSSITEDDLISYEPIWRKPIEVNLTSNLCLHTAPLPGSGSVLAFILNIMKGFNSSLATKSEAALFYHRLMETYKFAYGHRMNLEDSTDAVVLAEVEKLLSQKKADEIRGFIRDNATYSNLTIYSHLPVKEDSGTAHMSVITGEGDAVSVTTTVNLRFGSKIMLKTSGILLNNEMDDFVTPGIVNFFGVQSNLSRNLIVPGRRPFSSMAPSILLNRNGDVQLAIGAAGGTRITTMIAYVVLLNQFMGYELNEAIDMARLHHQLTPNAIQMENNFSEDILAELASFNHTITQSTLNAIVEGIERLDSNVLHGVSDYRKGGCVVGI